MKRWLTAVLALCCILCLTAGVTACGKENPPATTTTTTAATTTTTAAPAVTFNPASIGIYVGDPYKKIHGNKPYFTAEEITDQSFEQYAELDALGRCGVAVASIGQDLMPTEERGSIGSVKPTGWHTVKYDSVDGKYLYNRCHLIGYQLTGENANKCNLITGTRYLNVEGMLPFENQVADYVKETGNHVMYRVTPVFEGDDLLAKGVLMEAWSVEDEGDGICFCVFCYNVQPGITIDYATGDSQITKATQAVSDLYMVDKLNMIFHLPSCEEVPKISATQVYGMTETREELIRQGYHPCDKCHS